MVGVDLPFGGCILTWGEVANGQKVMFLGLHFLWEVRFIYIYIYIYFLLVFIVVFFCWFLDFDEDFVSLQVWCYERLTPLAPRRKG